jgi:TolB protein
MKKRSIMLRTVLLLIFSFGAISAYSAEVQLEISKQVGRKTDLAVAPLKALSNSDNTVANNIFATLTFDLDQSGYFEIVKHAKEIKAISDTEPADNIGNPDRWRGVGAEMLVKGSYQWNGQAGTLDVYVFDVVGQRRVYAKRYSFAPDNIRSTAHTAANDIIYRLTGEKGMAGSRIAFVSGGSKGKEVFVADADGRNVRQLTQDGSIVLGVSWSPNKDKLLYTSFKNGKAQIFAHDIVRGQRQLIASYPGLNAAAKFSPDGSKIAMVLSKDGNPEIYISDPQGRSLRRMTSHAGVDSSPCWSPDASKIAFISDRSGRPHLYIQSVGGGAARRVTYQGSYASAPSWSPDGTKIAFSSNMNGSFNICVLDLNDETITIVSQEGGEADEPDWAPDSRHLVYSSRVGGINQLYVVDTYDGKTTRLSSNNVHHLTPAWSL